VLIRNSHILEGERVKRKRNDLALGVDIEPSDQLFGQLELDFFPSSSPFAYICEEFQGFPKQPSPDVIREIFLKCKEGLHLTNLGRTRPRRNDSDHSEAVRRARVPRKLMSQIIKRVSPNLVETFAALEEYLYLCFGENKESALSDFNILLGRVGICPCNGNNKDGERLVEAKTDWARICVHVICAWHGLQSETLRSHRKGLNSSPAELVLIRSRTTGGKSRSLILAPSMSDYLAKQLV